ELDTSKIVRILLLNVLEFMSKKLELEVKLEVWMWAVFPSYMSLVTLPPMRLCQKWISKELVLLEKDRPQMSSDSMTDRGLCAQTHVDRESRTHWRMERRGV
ncbi:hypothetical protein HAX54_050223, partial [Datura stramonium]|nr:hypothetical protein [Datura stramonium]